MFKLTPANRNNPHIFFGQMYYAGTSMPANYATEPGICMGLALAWVRNLHAGRPLTYLPSETEGAIGHFMCEFGFGMGGPDFDAAAYDPCKPGAALQHPAVLHHCRRLGLKTIYRGVFPSFQLVRRLAATHKPAVLRTFLLSANRHATALALQGKYLALFNPNRGVALYAAQAALHGADLIRGLDELVRHAEGVGFGVLELRDE